MARQRNMPEAEQVERWEALDKVREAFPYTLEGFLTFAQTCVSELIPGEPDLNRVQADICKWLFTGPLYRMVQAQRGQAKTTMTAIFAVFVLIHFPKHRILIVSAAGKLSKEIASFVIQIMNTIEFLWMLRADENAGDRASVESYDVHWLFKGVSASPSIKCLGVDSSIQGSRADLLIADDIESTKNSRTVVTREVLEDLTREFESVCSKGDIVYLGTPQSINSIYNNLPGRGYAIRIWPGRYPTVKQMPLYNGFIAPMLVQDIVRNPDLIEGGGMLKDQGQPTCPEMFDEDLLIKKEVSQGTAKFQLQFMLSTALMDSERYPLKPGKIIVADFDVNQGPVCPIQSQDERNRFIHHAIQKHRLFWAVNNQYEYMDFDQTIMAIDGAGGGKNGDETGYAVIKTMGSFFYIYKVGGVKGGYDKDQMMELVNVAKEAKPNIVIIEQNFGHGAHAAALKPLFIKHYPVEIEEVHVTGQKELRIIDCLEPVISSGRMVISPQVLIDDWEMTAQYPTEKRVLYSFLHQLAMITRDKGCLAHEDRLDALASAVRHVVGQLDYDTKIVQDAKKIRQDLELLAKWQDPVTRREWLTGIVENHRHSTNTIDAKKRMKYNVFNRRR